MYALCSQQIIMVSFICLPNLLPAKCNTHIWWAGHWAYVMSNLGNRDIKSIETIWERHRTAQKMRVRKSFILGVGLK